MGKIPTPVLDFLGDQPVPEALLNRNIIIPSTDDKPPQNTGKPDPEHFKGAAYFQSNRPLNPKTGKVEVVLVDGEPFKPKPHQVVKVWNKKKKVTNGKDHKRA